jgi:hypothetical protein
MKVNALLDAAERGVPVAAARDEAVIEVSDTELDSVRSAVHPREEGTATTLEGAQTMVDRPGGPGLTPASSPGTTPSMGALARASAGPGFTPPSSPGYTPGFTPPSSPGYTPPSAPGHTAPMGAAYTPRAETPLLVAKPEERSRAGVFLGIAGIVLALAAGLVAGIYIFDKGDEVAESPPPPRPVQEEPSHPRVVEPPAMEEPVTEEPVAEPEPPPPEPEPEPDRRRRREHTPPAMEEPVMEEPPPPVADAPGVVAVFTPGGWANVYGPGGRFMGQSPVRLNLPAGGHTIELRPFGQPPGRRVRVHVDPGETTTVRFPVQQP